MLENGVNFIAALALHQAKRDKAVGLTHVTKSQKGLIWYYNIKNQELLTKSFHYGVIQGCRQRIKQIKKIVNKDTPENEANRLYREALLLQEQIANSEKIINGR